MMGGGVRLPPAANRKREADAAVPALSPVIFHLSCEGGSCNICASGRSAADPMPVNAAAAIGRLHPPGTLAGHGGFIN